MAINLFIDFSKFDKEMDRIMKQAAPSAIENGVRQALQELKLDADNVEPRTPHLEGHLRASGKVHDVKKELREIFGEITYGGKGVGYDVPYAHRWHEAEPGTVNWSEEGVGPKYLSSKLTAFAKKYMEIIATVVRKAR